MSVAQRFLPFLLPPWAALGVALAGPAPARRGRPQGSKKGKKRWATLNSGKGKFFNSVKMFPMSPDPYKHCRIWRLLRPLGHFFLKLRGGSDRGPQGTQKDPPIHSFGVPQYIHLGIPEYIHLGVPEYIHLGVPKFIHLGIPQYIHLGIPESNLF